MRTTLKRRIGRAAAGNGNGRAVFPPAPFTTVNFYRQPKRRGRGETIGLACAGALAGVLFGAAIAAVVTKAVADDGLQLTLPLEATAGAVAFVLLATLT